MLCSVTCLPPICIIFFFFFFSFLIHTPRDPEKKEKKREKKTTTDQRYTLYILETKFYHRISFFLFFFLQMSLICFITYTVHAQIFSVRRNRTNKPLRLLCDLRPRALIGNRLRLETAIMKARGRNLLGTSSLYPQLPLSAYSYTI